MTLLYQLFGMPGNSAEMQDKVDRKIEGLKEKIKKRNGRVNITQQVDAYSIENITHYTCYLKISSKGIFGSVSVPVTGRSYPNSLETDSRTVQMKNKDCATVYEQALNFAKRFIDKKLEVLIDSKSVAEIRALVPKIRSGEIQQETIMIPNY